MTTIRFGGKPSGPPPDPNRPYIWAGDRWLLLVTDTSDGVPESLDGKLAQPERSSRPPSPE